MKTKFLVAIFAIAAMCISCKGNSNDPTKGSSTPELIENFLGKTTNEADKIITRAGWKLVKEDEGTMLYFPEGEKVKEDTDKEISIDMNVKNALQIDVVDGIFAGAYFYSSFDETPELRKQTREIVNWAYTNVLKGKTIEDSYVSLTYEESDHENLNHDEFVKKLSAEDWIYAVESYDFEGGGYSISGGEVYAAKEEHPLQSEPKRNGISKQLNNKDESTVVSRAFLYERFINSF